MTPTTPASDVLSTLDRVIASRPFRIGEIRTLLYADLRETGSSTMYFRVESGPGSPPFTRVQVREPQHAEARGGIVVLGLEDSCFMRDDVGDHFGAVTEIDMPSAEAPPDAPTYYIHPQEWGDVRLGYAPSTGCLRSVVLDATGS